MFNMNEIELARFDVERWETVTSIGLTKLNPLGDCIVSLMARDGKGIILRLFDPEHSLDVLSLSEGRHVPYIELLKSVLWYVNENVLGDRDPRRFSAKMLFFYKEDYRWRAKIRFEIENDTDSDVFWVDTTPEVALATFSVDGVPSFVEREEPMLCDLTGHREALLFGLRGGEDALEGVRSCMMRGLGITMNEHHIQKVSKGDQG